MRRVIILMLLTGSCYAQKIKINEDGLYFNSRKIDSANDFLKEIGKPDSVYLNTPSGNDVYWYYDLGLRVVKKASKNNTYSFSLTFKEMSSTKAKEEDHVFTGEFLIGGQLIEKGTHIYRILQIPILEFTELDFEGEFYYNVDSKVSNLNLGFFYMPTKNDLQSISFNFH